MPTAHLRWLNLAMRKQNTSQDASSSPFEFYDLPPFLLGVL